MPSRPPTIAIWGFRAIVCLIDSSDRNDDAMTMSATFGEAGACECVLAALNITGAAMRKYVRVLYAL